MTLFKNKYRVESTRLYNWDYSQEGFYFITICTKNRQLFFGNVNKEEMILNNVGKIVKHEWLQTEKIRDNVLLDKFVVMPNHLHGIIVIDYQIKNNVETHGNDRNNDVPINVETHGNASLPGGYKNKFGPQSNNLSAIIRGFKGAAKNLIRRQYPRINFAWQARFYDHIIRREKSLQNIRKYIDDNPARWEYDRNNLEGLYI